MVGIHQVDTLTTATEGKCSLVAGNSLEGESLENLL